ncbi:MAG: CHAT domain-containing protein [Pleurocapsa sp. MO_226.B13]|nr:CHAT domain-containing protein [Pleurocapsa sp. MO_226.B13]
MFIPKIVIAKPASLTQSQINILSNRAIRAYSLGNDREAISIWLKILKQADNANPTVYSNLASVYWHTGNPGKAVRYWQKSIEIYRERATERAVEQLAATLTDTARAYNDLGQPRFSIPLLTEAIAIAKEKKLVRVKNVAYLALGNARTIQGDYRSAIDAYQNSLANLDRTSRDFRDLSIVVWHNLSKAYQQQALITRQKAIAAEAEGELTATELWQQVKGDRALAEQAVQKAVSIGKNSQSLALVEALIQRVKLAQDLKTDLADRVDRLDEAEVILATLPDSEGKVYALIDLGKLNSTVARSEAFYNSAIEIARRIDRPRVLSFATGAMGKHYEKRQQYNRALYWTQQAQLAAGEAQATDSLYQWDWQAARIYHAMGKTKLAIKAYERAIASLQPIRSNLAQAQGNSLLNFQTEIEPIYRGLIQLILANDPSESELQQVLETKDLLLLSELENYFQDDCFELETDLEAERLAYLKETNTAVVNTIILNNKTYLIWQFPDGQFQTYALDIAQTQLEELVTQWRFDLENRENDNYLQLSQQLYQLFFPPEIKSVLANKQPQKLIFVNDGILRNIPMAVLYDGEKFLVENYAITYSLGLNLRVSRPNSIDKKALAFGLAIATENFPPLPYVEQEIEQLGKLVDKEQFLNDEFTFNNFQQELTSSELAIVHIATHGQFRGTAETTFLQAYKSRISLKELEATLSNHRTNFPNNQIQLLVLSACETAASNARATLGMSGVAVRAGVNNVLGSLWAVNDRQIASLINSFYRYWIEDGLPKSEALRQAQLDLIKSQDDHPSNWSSTILIQG